MLRKLGQDTASGVKGLEARECISGMKIMFSHGPVAS